MTTITQVVRRTLASPKAQEQLLRMALLVLIWLWAVSIRLVGTFELPRVADRMFGAAVGIGVGSG